MPRLLEMMSLGLAATLLSAGCDAEDIETPDVPVAGLTSAIAAQGQLDTSFHSSGMLPAETSVATTLAAVADAGGGKVAFIGTDYTRPAAPNATVMRYLANGAIDTSWSWNPLLPGGDRVLTYDLGADSTVAGDLVVDGGNTFAVGTLKKADVEQGFLVKLDASGQLASGFSGDGMIKMQPFSLQDVEMTQILVDTHDRVVIAGIGWKDAAAGGAPSTGHPYLLLARFNATTGVPDEAFGSHGWVTRPLTTGHHAVVGLARPPLSSELTVAVKGIDQVMRFSEAGVFDNDFGALSVPKVTDVAETNNGAAIACTSDARLFGFDVHGTVIPSYSAHGIDVSSYAGESTTAIRYYNRFNRFFVVGYAAPNGDGKNIGTLTAFHPDGSFDRTFANGSSKVTTNFPNSKNDMARAIAVTGEKILVGYDLDIVNAPKEAGIARFLIDSGAVGEPCQDGRCDGTNVCVTQCTTTGSSTSGDECYVICDAACVPSSRSQACGSRCGVVVDDGCGGSYTCDACPPPPCVPSSRAHACGSQCGVVVDDGCGGSYTCDACPPPPTARPDLQMTMTPNGTSVTVYVWNYGDAPAGAFTYGGACTYGGQITRTYQFGCSYLVPGAACFQLIDLTNCYPGGALEFNADILYQVSESNEYNNSAPPLTLY